MLYLDFETRSTLDLRKSGVYAYAHHPDTKIVCTGYAFDDGPARVEAGFPFANAAWADDLVIVAHNAQMEREMLRAQGIEIPWERFIDTAALAARMSLPRKLEALAAALKLEEQKDMAGHRIMLKLARPKHGYDDAEDEFWEEDERPQDFEALREYCRQDVEVMRAIYRRLLPLSPQEARLCALTGHMNDRGVRVDLDAIPPALALLAASTVDGTAEFKRLTGGPGVKSYARAAAALGLPNLKKVTVRNTLRNGYITTETKPAGCAYPTIVRTPLTPATRRALELFQKLAKSSPAKLTALQRRTSTDGRVRGALIYCGAERTARWSSGGVQLHNLPRGLGAEIHGAFDALRCGCLDIVYDEPVATISEMLRGFFTGPFLVGDFAQIEARTLNWMAEQADMVKVFAEKGDPYCLMASKIYGRPITKKDTDDRLPPGITPRFVGKQAVLGCGYGLGWQKFQRTLDETFDVQVDPDFAMRVVETYRASSPKVCSWWRRLEQGFSYVVKHDTRLLAVDKRLSMGNVVVGGLRYAFIQLPSGRRLYYAEPEMTADGVRYWGRNIYLGGKWDRVSTYGGKLAENIVQAVSRDFMAESMLRLEEKGYKLLLTVHDEIVAECGHVTHDLMNDFKNTMIAAPSWADGLPIDVEVFHSHRYRK